MKKILVSLDEETIKRIQNIKDADFSAMGLKLSTSAVIRLSVWREWRNYTLQGIESNDNHVKG